MSYTTGIPASGQTLGASRPQILDNFTSLKTTIDQDHVDMNNSGPGKHNKSTYPEQAAAPTTAANEGAVYTKEAATTTELYWRKENNGAEIQMTRGTPTDGVKGYTFLPGGLLLQWGAVNATISGVPETFAIAFTTQVRTITFGNPSAGGTFPIVGYATGSLSVTGFTCTSSPASTVTYIAIGI